MRPTVTYRKDGVRHVIDCDFIAGCDGYHGISRQERSRRALATYERVYPFGWLGVLSETPPVLARADLLEPRARLRALQHAIGAAQPLLRAVPARRPGRRLERRQRSGTSCAAGSIAAAAAALVTGPSIEKSIAPLRSFVAEPMRFGRLFLAGDAAHIVPPTGAKGLNLAAADVGYLARALGRALPRAQRCRHRHVLAALPASGLARRAVLVVVHLADAQVSRDGSLRAENPGGGARLPRSFGGCGDRARRELRRAALDLPMTLLFDGIAYGMLLFVLAVGLAVTLGLMNFINLAHGAFAMAGGYITVLLMNRARRAVPRLPADRLRRHRAARRAARAHALPADVRAAAPRPGAVLDRPGLHGGDRGRLRRRLDAAEHPPARRGCRGACRSRRSASASTGSSSSSSARC